MKSTFYDWVTRLNDNPAQEHAYQKNGHTVVIAGPGSGKTRVLSLKMAQLIKDEIRPPQGIACLTYTRMMASELLNRLHFLGVEPTRPNIVVATVHSFCLQHIISPFRHMYDDRLPKIIRIAPKNIQKRCLIRAYEVVLGKAFEPGIERDFTETFNKLRRQRIDIHFANWKNNADIAQVIQLYESFLLDHNFVDFDIITRSALSMIQQQPVVRQSLSAKYPWIAVDEYQDLGYPLYRIVLELIENTPIKLFAIGDPDQCIFDFAGTDPKYLLQLSERTDVKPVITLEKNYRSTSELIEVSKAIINEPRTYYSDVNGGHCHVWECPKGKDQQEGLIAKIVAKHIAEGTLPQNITVLHRWRRGVDSLAERLYQSGIHFSRDKHPLYDRSMTIIKWLEDMAYWCLQGCLSYASPDKDNRTSFQDLFLSWCSFQGLELNSVGNLEDRRIYFLQSTWKYRNSDLDLHDWLTFIERDLQLESVFSKYEDTYPDDVEEYRKLKLLVERDGALSKMVLSDFAQSVPGVQLTTIHSSKGTEFKVVIIAGLESIEQTKNGRRLLYVGATRARNTLHLIYTKAIPSWSKSKYPSYPKYIKELRAKFRKDADRNISFHNY